MAPKRSQATRSQQALYLLHFLVELILGAIKMRGTYSGLDASCAPSIAKFARHHGVSLMALALLSFEVWRRDLIRTPTGSIVSLVLAFFHTGTMLVMIHAINIRVVLIHVPFAAGFWMHTLRTPS